MVLVYLGKRSGKQARTKTCSVDGGERRTTLHGNKYLTFLYKSNLHFIIFPTSPRTDKDVAGHVVQKHNGCIAKVTTASTDSTEQHGSWS